ncbi:MAG: DUF2852 domain-containing protein [Pseudomonadota bacterium]
MAEQAQAPGKVFDEKTFQDQLRPAWTPLNVSLMVLFFVTGLWPIGLAAIGYMMYGRDMGLDFSNWGKAKRSVRRASGSCSWTSNRTSTSGNAAFDAWRDQELERLAEERRKLEEAQTAFDEHMKELRMARDREEFEAFQRAWNENNKRSYPG